MFRETRELKRFPELLITIQEVNENPIVGSMAEVHNGTIWKIRPPPKRKKTIISVAAGERWVRWHQLLSEILLPMKTALVHWNGPHLMKEPLGTSGLKEGAAGTAGEQSQKRAVNTPLGPSGRMALRREDCDMFGEDNNCKLVYNRIRDTVAPSYVTGRSQQWYPG
jgi:hypothetical protein